MAKNDYTFDWNDLAFGSKKTVSSLKATFVAAPRQISQKRLKQLVKDYLPKGNIVLGIAKEQYVDGLGPSPAFHMLSRDDVQQIVALVNAASKSNRIYYLRYSQRDLPHILEKISFRQILLVRGSWHTVFHGHKAYYVMANRGIPYAYISPFADETEALAYATEQDAALNHDFALPSAGQFSAEQMLALADIAAKHSLDYSFQTGAVLGRKTKTNKYKLLAWSYNKVVPYQTYAMHHGNSREDNFSPPNDLNYYDAIHAEMNLLVTAERQNIDLRGTSLFINLLPCPTCAKVLSQTDVASIIYRHDHSAGYAADLFQATGIKLIAA